MNNRSSRNVAEANLRHVIAYLRTELRLTGPEVVQLVNRYLAEILIEELKQIGQGKGDEKVEA